MNAQVLVLPSSVIYSTSDKHERHQCGGMQHEQDKCNTSATRVLHERHESDTSEKILILITTLEKTYFHTPIFTMQQRLKITRRGTI